MVYNRRFLSLVNRITDIPVVQSHSAAVNASVQSACVMQILKRSSPSSSTVWRQRLALQMFHFLFN